MNAIFVNLLNIGVELEWMFICSPSSKRPSDVLGFPNPSFSLALEPLDVHER